MRLQLAALALLGVICPGTGAANMEISPVVVELGPSAPAAVVTIRNGDPVPVRYQLTAMAWAEPRAGEARFEPSQELAVFPPLFQLGPGEERKVRVGATVPPGDVERAWRLFVEALPSAADATAGKTSIRIRTRFALPVYLGPRSPRQAGALELARTGDGLAVTLRNRGNVHLRPGSGNVTLLGAGGERLREVAVPVGIVLAGAERTDTIQVPSDVCAGVRRATVVAELPERNLTAELALPAGACGP